MLDDIAIYIGVKSGAIIGGTAGAVVSLIFIEGPIWKRVCMFIGGLSASIFMTPWFVHVFNAQKSENAMAFVVGLFGMSLTSAIIKTIQGVDFVSLMAEIRAWTGRK